MDAQGRTRQTILRGNATLAGVEAALQGLSNADVTQSWEATPTINGAPAPVAATYVAVGDYAALVYEDAGGSLVYITLPAPQAGIFLADGVTADPVAIATASAAIIGTVLTGSGLAAATYRGGYRRSKLREYQ